MKSYFFNMTPEEKSSILNQHKELYNGYQSLQPVGNNSNPLYSQDFANDKHGITLSNKNVVSRYTNMNINESNGIKSQTCEQCGSKGITEEDTSCKKCGHKSGVSKKFTGKFDYVEGEIEEQVGNFSSMNVGDVEPPFDFETNGPIDAYDDDDKNYFSDDLNIFDDDDLMSARAFNDDDSFSSEDLLMNLRTNPESLDTDKGTDSYGISRDDIEFLTTNVDDDLRESFTKQKNKITEMFDRMKKY